MRSFLFTLQFQLAVFCIDDFYGYFWNPQNHFSCLNSILFSFMHWGDDVWTGMCPQKKVNAFLEILDEGIPPFYSVIQWNSKFNSAFG